MKPIQAYTSMRGAVRELGTDGFVSAVLRSQLRSAHGAARPWAPAPSTSSAPGKAPAALRPERDARSPSL